MNSADLLAFTELFKEACLKCFGHPLKDPLTETESKLFYNKVFEQTGLMIGWKSIKNYSFFIVNGPGSKPENPSVATLDTLSRYVLSAPYMTEIERKKKEGHYPYWYRYLEQFHRSIPGGVGTGAEKGRITDRRRRRTLVVLAVAAMVLALFTANLPNLFRGGGSVLFTENFHSLSYDSLASRGWFLKAKDTLYWNKRGESPGSLSLFTLKGDNWPDRSKNLVIPNLLLRKISCDCFTIETHLKNFIPRQNWQQAGILLLEDTGFIRRSIRISIAYNDYTGGYPKSRQILIQAITSLGNSFEKPEEIAHIPLYNVDSLSKDTILSKNLERSSLRIEKQGRKFRFLYANGISENTSFKEIAAHEFFMEPHYLGLFALKGFVDSADIIPARFTFFSLDCESCGK